MRAGKRGTRVGGVHAGTRWAAITGLLLLGGAACGDGVGPSARDGSGDLLIRYVQRLPTIDYVERSADPTREGWPAEGSTVTWHAVLLNTSATSRSVGGRWTVDGVAAPFAAVEVPPGGEAAVDLDLRWSFQRQRIAIDIEPVDGAGESNPFNNTRTFYSDALSIGFWIEEGLYKDTFQGVRIPFEDWAHFEIERWNTMLEGAVFPETPNGVLDRVRIDKIVLVPDQSLEGPTRPAPDDRSIDLQWGFPIYDAPYYAALLRTGANGSLLHELGHARYLIDVYGFEVANGIRGDTIEIEEGGVLIAGSDYMPSLGPVIFGSPAGVQNGILVHQSYKGLMNAQYDRMDRYSAAALNLIAGHRAVAGNANSPDNIGVFLQDLPEDNVLRLTDRTGQPLSGAEVSVYRAEPNIQRFAKRFDNIPDLTAVADGEGRVAIGRNPFADGPILHGYGANGVAIVRVAHAGCVGFTFLEVPTFNLAYWRGETVRAEYDTVVELVCA